MNYEIILYVILCASIICGFSIVAFNFGFQAGQDSVIVIRVPNEENEDEIDTKPEMPQRIKKLFEKIEVEKNENEINEDDDEETRVEKLRKKIEKEKVNEFFD